MPREPIRSLRAEPDPLPESAAPSPTASDESSVPLRRARVYGSVRSAHLERFRTMTPAVVLHRNRRYDFDPALVTGPSTVRQLGRLATVAHLLRTRYDAVELNEPLMVDRWLDLLAQVVAIRARSVFGRGRPTIGAYCIDLTDPVDRIVHDHHIPVWLARWWSRRVLRLLVRGMDRLAFGTDESCHLLARYVDPDVLASRARVFPALPAPCGCPDDGVREPRSVLFVGAFKERKGIRHLMRAWDALGAEDGLRLTVIGKGDLEPEVTAWAAGRAEVDLVSDPPRSAIHAAQRAAHVVVLLSQRSGWWREQVGLPIVEGLAHGCEIVTTDETGLAGWLREHGHTVVPAASDSGRFAAAIRAAASATRTAAEITADLPDTDTRNVADRWILSSSGEA